MTEIGLDFYNDFDSAACAWMGELMAGGHIPAGRIDSRSILDVRPDDLAGFRRCHFFAGIGGWAEALRLAEWEGPVWTGSPPCQPFSAAGQRRGRDDDRHLGPAFVDLVRVCRPPVLFGEQVASAEVVGRAAGGSKRGAGGEPAWAWCDDLFVRLEASGYACGAAVVPACSVGAPHIRQRLFFGAVRLENPELPEGARQRRDGGKDLRQQEAMRPARAGVADRLVGDAGTNARVLSGGLAGRWKSYADWFGVCWHPACRDSERGFCDCHTRGAPDGWRWDADDGWVADAGCVGVRRQQPRDLAGTSSSHPCREEERQRFWPDARDGGSRDHRPGPTDGFWRDTDWLGCRDGKWRPTKPGIQPLAHGVSGRVGLLRGAGNAIVPQAAAAFIASFREALTAAGLMEGHHMTRRDLEGQIHDATRAEGMA